jgi:hypothetical protein
VRLLNEFKEHVLKNLEDISDKERVEIRGSIPIKKENLKKILFD